MSRALPSPTRRAVLAALALAPATALAGCASAPRPRETPAEVRFTIEPAHARVRSDDEFVGSARVLAGNPARFRPGPRRFTIEADGYFPHDLETDLPSGLTTISVRLRPVPP